MTVDRRVGGPGDRIEVLQDLWRRLDPRPVDDVGDQGSRWFGGPALLLGIGAGLRLLCEYDVRPFRAHR
jgi:hypothetical protein